MGLYAIVNEERKLTESGCEIVCHALGNEADFTDLYEIEDMEVGELRVVCQSEMAIGIEIRQLIMRVQ